MLQRGFTRQVRSKMPLTALLLTLAAVGLTACGAPAAEEKLESPAVESPAAESPAIEAPVENEQPAESAETDSSITVEQIGNGPIGLRLDSPETLEADEQFSGKMITGPGGCLSLTSNERPYTLVFDAGTSFALRHQKPAVSDGLIGAVEVGNWVDFTGKRVALKDTTGVPDRCTNGSDFVVVIGSDS